MDAITVRGLRKTYDDLDAVCGIDLNVANGEVVALLGPNGAGKTTTVEILEGYRDRTGGDALVLGMDPATAGVALRERIGIVLQSSGIYPELTVAGAVRLHAAYYRHPMDVDHVIGLVGLGDQAGRRIKSLSGGQQRRVDLALGVIGDPEVLFLDEPTAGFDPTARRQAWTVVRELCALGKTVLLTTHHMDEAQHLADRVAIIARGGIIAEGTPDQLRNATAIGATITFHVPADATPLDIPDVGADIEAAPGRVVNIHTEHPTQALFTLTGWALERSHVLDGLIVERPSLEDAYLQLIRASEASHV